jgi:signal transduction histidine kinase/CheY-like chemotaxis protein
VAKSADADAQARAILVEQLEATCRFMPGTLLLGVVAAIVLVGIYSFFNPLVPGLYVWVGAVAATNLLRYWMALSFFRRGADFSVERWAVAFTIATTLTGITWSAPSANLIPGLAPASWPALASVANAIAAVGGYSLFPFFWANAGFLLGISLPTMIRCLLSGDLALEQIGIATGAFVLIALGAGRRLTAAHRDLIVARLDLELTRHAAEAASEAKSRFLAHMSHELRTPLNGVIGMADLLLRSALPERERRQVSVIARSGRTLLAILTDILDIARIEAGKLVLVARDFDLDQAVQEVDDLFRPRASEKGLELLIEWRPGTVRRVRGDRVRFVQVLGNLVGNAVKFTESGRVVITIGPAAALPAEGSRIRLEILDTGIGLNAEQRARIFDAFEQADASVARRFGGTGLGLSIARQLVLTQQGEIGVDSAPEGATRFWFELPFAPAEPALATRGPDEPLLAARNAAVLVVEDNPVNREVMTGMLEQLGCRPATAASGIEALERLERERYALVLMDLEMPGLDGFATTQRLRAREAERGSSRVPVVAVTAHALEGYRERCAAAGMDDYLTKPLVLAALARALRPHLASRVA